jgi:hypothetical protein
MDLKKQDARSEQNYFDASLDSVGRNSCSQQIKKEEQSSFTAKANQYVHTSKPSHC